jgi:hypothetical protein
MTVKACVERLRQWDWVPYIGHETLTCESTGPERIQRDGKLEVAVFTQCDTGRHRYRIHAEGMARTPESRGFRDWFFSIDRVHVKKNSSAKEFLCR